MSEELIERLARHEDFAGLSRQDLFQIAQLAEQLRQVRLFESLNDEQRARIAVKGQTKRYERGHVIIHEGDTDRIFYVILKGQVRVWTRQGGERPRLLNYYHAGDFFGEQVFRNDGRRTANVDVEEDVLLLAFEREGFESIVAYPRIRDYLWRWASERMRRSNQPFTGKHWDEISVVHAHKSWVALARVVALPVGVIVVTLVIWFLVLAQEPDALGPTLSVVIAITFSMVLWIMWMGQDWRNDDFFVTSKRVIHIERVLVPPFPVERHEAAIEHVQDITTRNHGLWTWFFGVHAIEIKTAATGTIRFPYLANADEIREEIFGARQLALTRRMLEERSRIRQALFAELGRPLQEIEPLESGETVEVTPTHTGLLRALDYFTPRPHEVQPDQIKWRKGRVVLLVQTLPSLLLFGVSMVLLILALTSPGFLGLIDSRDAARATMVGGAIGLFLVAFAVYIWKYDGWRNDVYIVTESRIIDIEGSPFHLRKESRTEGTFDIIQNIDYESPGLLARILRLGHVTIDTAAQRRAFTFTWVERPEKVQQEVFKRLVAYRENRARRERERQYAELAKWFDTYHHEVIGQED